MKKHKYLLIFSVLTALLLVAAIILFAVMISKAHFDHSNHKYSARISFFGDSHTSVAYAEEQVIPDDAEFGFYRTFFEYAKLRAFLPQMINYAKGGSDLQFSCEKITHLFRQERAFIVIMSGFNDVGTIGSDQNDVLTLGQKLARQMNETLTFLLQEHPARPLVVLCSVPPRSRHEKTNAVQGRTLATVHINNVYKRLALHYHQKGLPIVFCDVFKHLSDGNSFRVPGVSLLDEIHLNERGNAVVGLAIATAATDLFYSKFPLE